MNTDIANLATETESTEQAETPNPIEATGPVRVAAFGAVTKRLGNWTSGRSFEVRAHRGVAVLDLRSPQIPEGDITVAVDLTRCTLKLLVPEDAQVDDWDLHRTGRSQLKDGQRPQHPGSRRIVLAGRMDGAEIRVNRGGVAMLAAMCSREYLADLRTSHKQGVLPTVDDPTRVPDALPARVS